MKIVTPHKRISRDVVLAGDVERVLADADEMVKLMNPREQFVGRYNNFYAMAHPQVTETDPLRFFVLNPSNEQFKEWQSVVIINPVILRHTQATVERKEGCMSYANVAPIMVARYNKCEVEFSELRFTDDKQPYISGRVKRNLSGIQAEVFQHEIDHLNGRSIYD